MITKNQILSLGFHEISEGWFVWDKSGKKTFQILTDDYEDFHLSFGVHEHNKTLYRGRIPTLEFLKGLIVYTKKHWKA